MDMLSFGTMNTAQNRFFWRGAYNAGTIYNPYDIVSYLGSAYISLTTQNGVLPTNTGSWDQMTSAGAVSSVAGRVGNVILSASDLTDGVTGTGAVVLATDPTFNTINVTGNSGLNASGTGGQIAGGFGSPSAIRHYIGDGSGWRIEFAKRVSSVDTVEAWITDGGVINTATGYQINGSAPNGNVLRGNGTNFVSAQLAASDLSNGVSGTGAVVLASGASLTPAKSVASNSGGGTNAGLQVVAASPAFALEASGQAADQKWWDFLVAGTSLFCRSINDANSSAFNWLTVNRGSGTTISNAVFACPVSATGFQISGAAASGNVLRGNGTNFVSAQLASADLSDTSSLVTLTGTQTLTNKTVGSGGLAGLTPSKQIFTTSGTFTIPTGVKAVKVTVLGGGGAGGGSSSGSNNGGGGAAGGCGIKWLSGLTPGNTLTVTVGSGGTGVSNATGNSGGSSSVASGTQTITTITTNGGTGGFGGGVTSAGAFETAAGTGGDINMGGSGGGFSTTAGPYGGAGGNSMFGVGGGNSNGAGRAAIGFGAGGSGSNSSLTGAGGAGAPGIVIFEWMI